ncbi:hypothetical protein [Chelativorans sp. Marseille-P2723]|uniref:hypothetical protein n=1 Tax=Chelativorans sp. Marseille-P2723 TaxID=2709133 RepID=UPI00156F3585|nr:hypothetical protein [Chelativorans sp. Marseille-P2723]
MDFLIRSTIGLTLAITLLAFFTAPQVETTPQGQDSGLSLNRDTFAQVCEGEANLCEAAKTTFTAIASQVLASMRAVMDQSEGSAFEARRQMDQNPPF